MPTNPIFVFLLQLHVSGVLAAVTAGLVMSFYAGGRISPGVEHSMHTFWSMATYVANTIIFFVSGLIIGDRAIFDAAIGVSRVEVRTKATLKSVTVVPKNCC